jgi:Flp pilus assembly pilin Flp
MLCAGLLTPHNWDPRRAMTIEFQVTRRPKTMKPMLGQMWREDEGVLSFEWILLLTLLVLGLISGLTGARDAFIDELGDIAEGMICLDQSFTLAATDVFPASGFSDPKPTYMDCDRATAP